MKTRLVVQVSALGFLVAAVMFFSLAIIWWLFDFIDPIEAILTGQVVPGTDLFQRYLKILPLYFALDNILVLGWITGWVGIMLLVRKQNHFYGNIVSVLGIAGPILDFFENEISRALIGVCVQSGQAPIDWVVGWRVIRELSFLIPYAAAALVGVGLWSSRTLDRVTTCIGTIGVVIAILGEYFFPVAAMAWWPVWYINLGMLLWRRRMDFPLEEAADEVTKPNCRNIS